MSPLETQRLAAVSAAKAPGHSTHAATGDQRTGETSSATSVADVASRSAPAAQQGVRVDVRGAVQPGEPPVDAERVAEIRSAIKNGTYPIVPAQIADALIAARHMLSLSA